MVFMGAQISINGKPDAATSFFLMVAPKTGRNFINAARVEVIMGIKRALIKVKAARTKTPPPA